MLLCLYEPLSSRVRLLEGPQRLGITPCANNPPGSLGHHKDMSEVAHCMQKKQ